MLSSHPPGASHVPRQRPDRATNADRNGSGRVRPRLSARRRIPCAAFTLNKNRVSVSGSRTCDNEHSTAALGDSVELRIQHSPFDVTKPCVAQRPEKDSHVPSLVACE